MRLPYQALKKLKKNFRLPLTLLALASPRPLLGAELNPAPSLPTTNFASQKEAALAGKYKALETFAQTLHYLESMYVDPDKVALETLIDNALDGVIAQLDPHTVLMPKKAFEQLTSDTRGKFGGIGVIVSEERGKLIIISPLEDSPAMQAGLKSGDEITAINGTALPALGTKEAMDLLRGEPGSSLQLAIRRKGVNKILDFSLRREIIKVHSVRGQRLSDDIFYVRLSSFQENTADELHKILSKQAPSLRGLVCDLRDNPGGLLDQAIKVVDLFIESGLIVSTVGRDPDRIEREFAHKKDTFSGFPMIVLINEGSASASEIVAGALQDHQRALVLGTTSFGKGSVQTLVSLPDGSGLKLTVARYFTPNDRSIQAKGIVPDIIVPATVAAPPKDKHRRESDLSGHIESQDLSPLSEESGILHVVKAWPETMQKDPQLVSAYTYVKGWSVFQPRASETKASQAPL